MDPNPPPVPQVARGLAGRRAGMIQGMSRRFARRPSGGTAAPGVYAIDTGTAELIRDRDRVHAYTLLVNGAESSHADLNDPAWLEFEYLQWMSAMIRTHLADRPALDVLHLGAAGCSLARNLITLWPESRHLAVEVDAKLAELVREWFGLPRAPQLRIRIGDAREITESLSDASFDVVVRDVFAGTVTPGPLLTAEFAAQVRRVLRPGGLYLANCADRPDLAMARSEAATIASVFDEAAIAADPPTLKGRRRGNIVLAGSDRPITSSSMARELRGGVLPAALWDGGEVVGFAQKSPVLHDSTLSRPESLLAFLRAREPGHAFESIPEDLLPEQD